MQVQLFVQKKNIKDSIEATGKLSKQLSSLIRENMDLFEASSTSVGRH